MTMRHCLLVLLTAGVLLAAASPLKAQAEYEFRGGTWSQAPPPAEGTATGELSLVRWQFDRGKYRKAVKAAEQYLERYSDPAGREEVMLIAGEAEMKRGRLFQGYEWFEKQLASFPDGRFSDRALDREFTIAEAFLAGKKRIVLGFIRLPARDEGLDILARIAEHVPGTPRAEKALMQIANDRFEHREWFEATEAYDRYVRAFPQGTHAAEAMLKAAQATHLSFGGIGTDETPLIEAEQRYREFARKYPLSADEAGVELILEDIRLARAAKLLEEGRFYQRVGKYRAAAFSYQKVIDLYPGTDSAAVAEQALESLEGLTGEVQPEEVVLMPTTAPAKPSYRPPRARPARPPAPAEPRPDPADLEPIDLEKLPASTAPAGDRP